MRMRLIAPGTAVTFIAAIAIAVGFFVALRDSRAPHESSDLVGLNLVPATTSLRFVNGAMDDIPDQYLGTYFMDIESGRVQGWYDPLGKTMATAFSDDNRLVEFVRYEREFIDGVQYEAGTFIADRKTGRIYMVPHPLTPVLSRTRFNGNATTGGPGYILLRRDDLLSGANFTVVKLDPRPHIVSTFEAQGVYSLMSNDGRWAAVYDRVVSLVDLKTGKVTTLPDIVEWPSQPRVPPEIHFQNMADGSGFVLTASSQSKGYLGSWIRYDWDGALVAQGEGHAFFLSPDGSMIASETLLNADDVFGPSTTLAIETASGDPAFRVTGAHSIQGWLADNESLMVSNHGYDRALAKRGSISTQRLVGDGDPSPTDPNLFFFGDEVVDKNLEPVSDAKVTVWIREFVPPWGPRGDEIRFMTPWLGHDCCESSTSLLQPYVEQPPLTGPPLFRVHERRTGITVRNAPASPLTIDTLVGDQRFLVHETVSICSIRNPDPAYEQCTLEARDVYEDVAARTRSSLDVSMPMHGTWARVTTPDGLTGWILLAVRPIGIQCWYLVDSWLHPRPRPLT